MAIAAALVAGPGGCELITGFGEVAYDTCLPGEPIDCYGGPEGTSGVGECESGVATCVADGSGYGPCIGEVAPATDPCDTPEDEGCDGAACSECMPICEGKRCGEDGCGGLCNGQAAQTVFWVPTPSAVRDLAIDEASQSLYAVMDDDSVLRIDQCDGAVLADAVAVTGAVSPFLKIAAPLGDRGLAVLGSSESNGTGEVTGAFLSLDTLEASGPITLDPGFATQLGRGLVVAGALAVTLEDGTLGRIGADGRTCVASFAAQDGEPRGLTFDGTKVHWINDGAEREILELCPDVCSCVGIEKGPVIGDYFFPFDLLSTPSGLVAAGTLVDVETDPGAPVEVAVIERFGADGARLEYESGGSNPDAFLALASFGDTLFAGGASSAASATSNPIGEGVLFRTALDFDASSRGVAVPLDGTRSVRDVVADATGVYAAGVVTGGGFIVKCNHELDCGAP